MSRKAFLFFCFLFPFIPIFASAQVVINEIAWMGSAVKSVEERQWWRYEWIELYNPADAAIPLDGWKIELWRETLEFETILQGTVGAQGYFLAGASDRISGVDFQWRSLAGKLANAGQRVVFKDAGGNVVEEIDARGGWFAGANDTKVTMERRFPQRPANDPDNWGSSQNTGGTPKMQNSVFGTERFGTLSPAISAIEISKKEPFWFSLWDTVTTRVFMRAFGIALVSAAGILALRQHVRPPNEGSYDDRLR